MEWRDEGALLSVRRHGETAAIIEVFTAGHGRHAGVVRGGTSRKIAPILQPGAQLDLTWRARLDEHIGAFTVEPLKSRAADLMSDRQSLAGLHAVTALLTFALPEREAHPRLYARTIGLLDMIGATEVWPLAYLRWEMALLDELGFGLDLSGCAVTGTVDDLVYVSPRSGRAISRGAAGEWADRLLPLSPAMTGTDTYDVAQVLAGLGTTGHFLVAKLAEAMGNRPVPEARQRLLDLLARAG
ncbi:DNA repair protein RecO [Palleronia sp. KMU-117]|uniref:DNA repair protein RecO n=1 Tax=Palleronia sp. KMU-117 TaxID=3434108 RepID=UPI003D74EDCC